MTSLKARRPVKSLSPQFSIGVVAKAACLYLVASCCILLGVKGFACEPCGSTLDFEKTVQRADLVLLGKKVEDGPWSDPRGQGFPGGPDWIEVRVLRVLKGSLEEDRIKVNSWDGMCPYGIQAGRQPLVMFLVRDHREDNDERVYGAVNAGCAVKAYPFKRGKVEREGKRIPLGEFIFQLQTILKK